MRVLYAIALPLAELVIDTVDDSLLTPLEVLRVAYLLLPLLFGFGLLSSLWSTLLWAIEQADTHLLGSTPRASDARILLSVAVNVGAVCVCAILTSDNRVPLIAAAALGTILSHNWMGTLGISKKRDLALGAVVESQLQRYFELSRVDAGDTEREATRGYYSGRVYVLMRVIGASTLFVGASVVGIIISSDSNQ